MTIRSNSFDDGSMSKELSVSAVIVWNGSKSGPVSARAGRPPCDEQDRTMRRGCSGSVSHVPKSGVGIGPSSHEREDASMGQMSNA